MWAASCQRIILLSHNSGYAKHGLDEIDDLLVECAGLAAALSDWHTVRRSTAPLVAWHLPAKHGWSVITLKYISSKATDTADSAASTVAQTAPATDWALHCARHDALQPLMPALYVAPAMAEHLVPGWAFGLIGRQHLLAKLG